MKRLLLIPGDGIGPEVIDQAKKLISALSQKFSLDFSLFEVDWGAERWLKRHEGIPEDAFATITNDYDAILFGALGDKRIPDMAHGRAILLRLRFELELYINLRPIKLLVPHLGVLKDKGPKDIDMVIFRENTQDLYLGLGKSLYTKTPDEIAIDESKHSYHAVMRIIVAAFEYALVHQRKRVTLIDKHNAIKFGGSLWQRCFAEAREHYNIEADHLLVDIAAMQMVKDPGRFDVIVTSNLFGDILSDLGAALAGGLGLAASANINPGVMALFEPIHGSAPDIAGKNLANPFACFLSVAMMMDYFGYKEVARAIEKAITDSLICGATTKDLGGRLSCPEAADGVIARLTNL